MLRSVSYDSRSAGSRYTTHCPVKRVNVIGPVWLDNVIVFGPLNTYAYSEPGGFGMLTNRCTLQTGLFGIPQGTRTILVFGDQFVTVKMMLFGATSW